ncbi:orotate phosphoribosyltransferase [Spirosoma montaniterrae]|uniref:Orotate phosphoribosyltransferase n=2 Tax=Spirosoma montaniterrae TaxID=1178516 RepID=A0A1P9X4F7_9BACT|nr:orotate phosphoribosyltransferase [Spirosoma montaniterrae]
MWAMLAHLSALTGLFTVVGSVVGPLIVWQVQKERSAFVDFHGKEALNFNITIAIASAISFVLFLLLVGFVLIWIVGAVWLIFTLIAAVKANNGEYYRYPLTFRFVK